jgi:hypothetical protein
MQAARGAPHKNELHLKELMKRTDVKGASDDFRSRGAGALAKLRSPSKLGFRPAVDPLPA